MDILIIWEKINKRFNETVANQLVIWGMSVWWVNVCMQDISLQGRNTELHAVLWDMI